MIYTLLDLTLRFGVFVFLVLIAVGMAEMSKRAWAEDSRDHSAIERGMAATMLGSFAVVALVWAVALPYYMETGIL